MPTRQSVLAELMMTTNTQIGSQTDNVAPPLSLYHLLEPEVLANPYPLYHRLRTEDPVHWDPFLHAWVVTRYADIVRVLHDFSAERTPTPEQLTALGLSALNPIAQVMVKQMLFLDPPAHTRLRSLASSAFTPSRVQVLRSHIQEIANELIGAVEASGGMDLIADFAAPLPAIVTAEMLGVPAADHDQLKAWSTDFAEMLGNFQHNPDRAPRVLRSLKEMTAYFRSAIIQQRYHPREGLINSFLTAEIHGDRFTEEEVIANVIVTMVGGQETTTNLIGNGLLSLLRNPEQLEKLCSDPSLTPSAVEELLRYESPSQHTARLAPADTELGGRQIRKRQAVIAVMAAGNRDPERFTDPDRLDITRKDNHHLAFGWAAHFCFGAPLARIEGQVAFETLLRRLANLAIEGGPLVWRTNLGLRGLTALPIRFTASAKSAAQATSRSQAEVASINVNRTGSIFETSPLSETKRQLLEKYVGKESTQERQESDAITRRPTGEPIPLSLAQEQMWLREMAGPGLPPIHNESITIHRAGPLDGAVLERAFAEIIRRHQIWRTTFNVRNGIPVQVIHPAPSNVSLSVVDLKGIPEGRREEEALRVATEQARQPFDLKRGPLVRAQLVTLDDRHHRLYLTMHQSIVDGVSVYQILPSELIALYEAFSADKPSPLPELPIQYADFALWERQWLQGDVLAGQMAYWRRHLAGELPVLQWPTERLRPVVQTLRGAIRPFLLPKQLTSGLKEVSRQEGVTFFMTLLAGFTALLRCYTQQASIIVGTVAPAGRKRPEAQRLLGHFLNPVALYIDLEGHQTFRDLMRQTREVVLGALLHDDVPFERVVNELKLKPDPGRHPLFQLVISLAPPMPPLPSGWDQTPMDVESGGARWDLYLELSERANGVLGRAQYNPDLFPGATITRTLEDLQVLLEGITPNPRQRLADLPALIARKGTGSVPSTLASGTTRSQ
jgi:cytochrome P450